MVDEQTPLLPPDDKEEEQEGGLAAVYAVAIAVSAAGVTRLGSQYLLKDTFHLGPAEVAFYLSFHSLGWIVKPLWGFITDSFPIMSMRRKPYLIIVSAVGLGAFLLFGQVSFIWQFIVLEVVVHGSMSFLSVIAQALLVQRSGDKNAKVASFNFSSYFGVKIATDAVSTFAAGHMLEHSTPRHVLMTAALLMLPALVLAPWLHESLGGERLAPREQISAIWTLFRRPEVYGTAIYIFVFCSMPNASSAMFFFSVDVLHFDSEFMAFVAVVSSLAQAVGLLVYHRFLTDVPFQRLFAVATILAASVSMTPLLQIFRLNRAWGINDHVFALLDTFVILAVAEILWIPMLVLASRLCPPSVEGTTFAVFLSVHNLGLWFSGAWSGLLTSALGVTRHHDGNLWILVVICAACMLIPLSCLHLVPSADPELMRNTARTEGNPQDA